MATQQKQSRRAALVGHQAVAGIYVRISDDKEGAGLGVARQEKDCRARAERLGMPVARVYVDNDLSAYQRRTVRREYQQMMRDLRAGIITVVIVWHLDRLYRQPRELEDMIELCEDGSRQVVSCWGEYDLSNSDAVFHARIMVAHANKSSADTARRVRRVIADRQAKGLPATTGGARPFGYSADRMQLVEGEAAALRDAAERVLAGEPLRSICLDLNARGLRTTKGHLWSTVRLRDLLLSLRIAGMLDSPTTGRIRAAWPAIVSEAQHARLRAILTDPARRTNRGAPRRFLLSGILRCGECAEKLIAKQGPRSTSGNRPTTYSCAIREHKGCGRVTVVQHHADDHIVKAVFAALDSVRVPEEQPVGSTGAAVKELVSDQEQLDELAALYAAQQISAREWMEARAPIARRIAERSQLVANDTASTPARTYAGRAATLRDEWPSLRLEQRRAVIESVLDHVVVLRTGGGRVFDPNRLVPVWRT